MCNGKVAASSPARSRVLMPGIHAPRALTLEKFVEAGEAGNVASFHETSVVGK